MSEIQYDRVVTIHRATAKSLKLFAKHINSKNIKHEIVNRTNWMSQSHDLCTDHQYNRIGV